MWSRWLIGSVIFHGVVLGGLIILLPVDRGLPESPVYFEMINDSGVSESGQFQLKVNPSKNQLKPVNVNRLLTHKPQLGNQQPNNDDQASKVAPVSAAPPPSEVPMPEGTTKRYQITAETGAHNLSNVANNQGNVESAPHTGKEVGANVNVSLNTIGSSSQGTSAGNQPVFPGPTGNGMNPTGSAVVDHPAILRDKIEPIYPKEARDNGWQGVVKLQVQILKNGRVGQIIVIQSSGYDCMDKAAIQAGRLWKYKPALKDGKPVESIKIQSHQFNLEASK